MKAISIVVRIFVLSVSLFSASSFASTAVYDQAPVTTGAGISSHVFNVTTDPGFTFSLDSDTQAWAYFNLTSSASFNQITWYGAGSQSIGNFAVGLIATTCAGCYPVRVSTGGSFAGNLLSPNQSLYDPSQISASLVTGTTDIYAYTIDLSSMVTLDASSPYYALSVVNNGGSFFWAASNTGNGNANYTAGTGWYSGNTSLAFTLSNTNPITSPVPEPPAYALMLSGLGMIGFIALRRRKHQFGPLAFA